MKIALLLSGRITRYLQRLIPLLESARKDYEIDIFISVNDTDNDFYSNVVKNLEKWLKKIYINKYEIPIDFNNYYTKECFLMTTLKPSVDSDKLLYHSLSWYFNDTNVFNMAKNYADSNNFEYDIYFRTRAEIIVDSFPNFIIGDKLYCAVPVANYKLKFTDREVAFIDGRLHPHCDLKFHDKDVIAEIAYGSRKYMEYYCSVYEYILKKNTEMNGKLFICNEVGITMNIIDKTDQYEFFEYPYSLDPLRHSPIESGIHD